MSTRLCQRCSEFYAVRDERFCTRCRQVVLTELQETGYLQRVPRFHAGQSRTYEQRENVYETKYGVD